MMIIIHAASENTRESSHKESDVFARQILPAFMPVYQLEIAIALAAAAAGSLALFAFNFPHEAKIQLPIGDELHAHGQAHDPFDITKQEDRVDGYPIKAAEFWDRVC
jgi:hypothetical protein